MKDQLPASARIIRLSSLLLLFTALSAPIALEPAEASSSRLTELPPYVADELQFLLEEHGVVVTEKLGQLLIRKDVAPYTIQGGCTANIKTKGGSYIQVATDKAIKIEIPFDLTSRKTVYAMGVRIPAEISARFNIKGRTGPRILGDCQWVGTDNFSAGLQAKGALHLFMVLDLDARKVPEGIALRPQLRILGALDDFDVKIKFYDLDAVKYLSYVIPALDELFDLVLKITSRMAEKHLARYKVPVELLSQGDAFVIGLKNDDLKRRFAELEEMLDELDPDYLDELKAIEESIRWRLRRALGKYRYLAQDADDPDTIIIPASAEDNKIPNGAPIMPWLSVQPHGCSNGGNDAESILEIHPYGSNERYVTQRRSSGAWKTIANDHSRTMSISERAPTQYRVQACNNQGCSSYQEILVPGYTCQQVRSPSYGHDRYIRRYQIR